MKKLLIVIFFCTFLTSLIQAQVTFNPIDTNFASKWVYLPIGYSWVTAFTAGDTVQNTSTTLLETTKDNFDLSAYVPRNGSSVDGWLFITNASTSGNATKGDGGGASIVPVRKDLAQWIKSTTAIKADFSTIGLTWNNTSGGVTTTGTVMTGENNPPINNAALKTKLWSDTSDFGGYKRYLNYGWMDEYDVVNNKNLGKRFAMGRFSHEGALFMPDGKTVYMTDDAVGGVFFRFIADNSGDYSLGQLSAYKQSLDGSTGLWLNIPRVRDSLNIAHDVALRMGATFFLRLKGITRAPNGTIYISESGVDLGDVTLSTSLGGTAALHHLPYLKTATTYADTNGRLLKYDVNSNRLSVFLNGGSGSNPKTNFSNPNSLSIDAKRNLLYICEDIQGTTANRSLSKSIINEVYVFDLANTNILIDSLKRFANGPITGQPGGLSFTPDFETMFLSVQNPDSKDFVPFNGKSATVAIVPTYVKTQSFLLRTSPLVGVLNGVNVSLSGFSGLDYIPGSGNMFTTITDRGANASADVLNGGISTLVFPFPNFSPTIIQIAAESDSIRIVSTLPIKRPNGTPTTGVPPSLGFGNTGEAAWDLNFNPIPPDNYGIDCEGIAPGINNDYWVCEEYGTTVWNIDKKSGKLIRRYAPFQSVPEDILIDTVFKYRNPNKGFECLAVTPKGKVYAIVQQPLYWPNAATGDNSRTHRMLEIDPATGKTRMFAYVHELPTTNNKNSNWKLGDMTAINDYEFLVVEHSVKSGEDSKKVFKIDIRNATPITSENYGGKTIEGLDVSLFPTYGIVPVKKQLYFDALANGWDPLFQKPEGLTIMNDSTIAMTEDNDFSINSPNSDGTIINTNIPTRMYIFTMPQALKLNYIRIDKRINPRLSISPNILKVDSIDMGLTACRTITLTNPGTDPVRITKQYLSSNDGDFSFTPLTGKDTLLNPGDVRTIQVCFNPLQRGTRQGRISFKTDLPLTYETPRQDSSTISIELRGNGTPLGKLVGPMIFKRDSALVGTVICHIDTVYNQGSEYINIKSASVSGPDAADFSVSTVTPVSIAPSKYATFTICGTPSAEGNRIGKLDIVGTSNGKTVTTNIVLGLYGLKACATALPIVLFTEKKIAVGSADTQKIEVKNCGERPAIYSLSIKNDSTSSYTVLGATSTAPVNPLQSAFFTIRFAPTVKTSAYANAVVTSPGVPNMNITLSGTGASAKVIVSAPLVPPTPVGNTSSEFDLILTNVGNISWTPGMPSVNGPFVYRSGANQIIAPGADGKLTFAFVPQSLGTNDGSITFKQCTPTIDKLLKINLSGVGTSSSAVTDQEAPTFSLENNYPNPFSHQTTFTYELSKASFVEFSILSLEGNKLTRLVSQRESAGKHSVTFDASPFASGIYIYSLKTEYGSLSKQMNIVK